MVVCSISIIPVGTGSTSVSPYVARCHEVLRGARGLKYQLTPMATILEGELENVLDVVAELHGATFQEGAKRVLTTVIIDERRDKALSMEGKVESVKKKLGA
jgi:uncharacterized protein (TIGR00106 family)